MSKFLAQFAAEEFTRRRDALITAHAAGKIAADAANANAQLWLAIACAARADLPELHALATPRIFPPGTMAAVCAADLADPLEWRAELTRARDRAVRKALSNPKDLHTQQRAWDLQTLAVQLGCPETTPIKEERNAA